MKNFLKIKENVIKDKFLKHSNYDELGHSLG